MPIRPNDIKVKTNNMLQFVIALHCEAKPIIQHYRMKLCGRHGQAQFFQGEKARLAVTGVGSLSSAIATTAMGERFQSADSLWLNVGICGAKDAPIGDAFLGNKITSDYSLEALYPQLAGTSPWRGAEIRTLSAPSNRYETDRVFDMEAFGFYTAALAFSTSECIQCVKVVSDNSSDPAGKHFDKAEISDLVGSQIPNIEAFLADAEKLGTVNRIGAWAIELRETAETRYSFTETERHQLYKRVLQLDALFAESGGSELQTLLNEPEKSVFLEQLQRKIDERSPQRVC